MKAMLSVFLAVFIMSCATAQNPKTSFKPGELWPDNNQNHINAHGGGILFHNNKYYWFGEHKTEGRKGNTAQVGVHVYSSDDLYNWKDEGIALAVEEDTLSEITRGCVLERPKVIYNEKTGQFVMWFHLELKGQGYKAAKTGVAVSDHITGPYKYLGSRNPNKNTWPVNYPEEAKKFSYPAEFEWWTPSFTENVNRGIFVKRDFENGQMARDMTLFVDDDGKAYHIHASEENLTLHISELFDDYLSFTGKWTRVFPGGHNEAPAIFKTNGKYYLVTSGCTGWDPNEARLAVADSLFGEWTYLGNPCVGNDANLTFHSQSTFVLPVQGKKDAFIFMADRWRPENAIDGRYVWLPIKIEKDKVSLEWLDEWDLEVF